MSGNASHAFALVPILQNLIRDHEVDRALFESNEHRSSAWGSPHFAGYLADLELNAASLEVRTASGQMLDEKWLTCSSVHFARASITR
jgi:hypothetical protein